MGRGVVCEYSIMNKKEAIIILGGGLIKDEDGSWRTTNFNEQGDKFGVSGDRLRIIAGSYLYKDNTNLIIVASGGKGQLKNIPDTPAVSEVMKKELIELGVPVKKIVLENNSDNTWQQLQELKKIINKMELNKIIIVSNKWHLARIQAMIEKDEKLINMFNKGEIELASAEYVVVKYEPKKWKKVIDSVYSSEKMKKRIALEEEGVQEIKEGKYKFK